jgi:phenol 2-monooxygenase
MNVSMMDSFNLSWKLAHVLNGVVPKDSSSAKSVLASMFSGQIGALDSSKAKNLTHEEFLQIFLEGSGFTSGCGIEYPESCLVKSTPKNAPGTKNVISGTNYLSGNLKAGRRINDCTVKRYADANLRHLHDGEFGLIPFVFA